MKSISLNMTYVFIIQMYAVSFSETGPGLSLKGLLLNMSLVNLE